MSEAKPIPQSLHTPGPWTYDPDCGEVYFDDGDVLPLIGFINFESVAKRQADADGKLCAAAPAMLAALKNVRDTHSYNGPLTLDSADLSQAVLKMVERAIAEAEA